MNKIGLLLTFCEEIYEQTKDVSASRSAPIIVRNVFFVFLAKARTLLKSITLLYKNGQYPPASVLLRSLLELYIQAKWISEKDVVGLTTRYAELATVSRLRAFYKTKPDLDAYLHSCSDEEKKRFDEKTRIAKAYGYESLMKVKDWRPQTSKGHPISVSQMAKDVGLDYEYQVTYNKLCETTHIGPGSDTDYQIVSSNGLVPCIPDPPIELYESISYFVNIYLLANRHMGQTYTDAVYMRLRLNKFAEIVLKD